MVNSTVNTVVMIMFGLFLGVLATLIGLIWPKERDREFMPQRMPRMFWGFKSESGREFIPRSHWMLIWTFWALVAMFILILWYSPITINWWILLGSVLVAAIPSRLIFIFAKTGKIRLKS